MNHAMNTSIYFGRGNHSVRVAATVEPAGDLREYTVDPAGLELDSKPVVPQAGDEIREVIDGQERTFHVQQVETQPNGLVAIVAE